MMEHDAVFGLGRFADPDPEKEESGVRVIIGRHWTEDGVRWTAEATSVPAYNAAAETEQEARKALADKYRVYADEIDNAQ